MQLFSPQVQLIKVTDAYNPDHYYLHVVTNTSQTNYESDGYTVGTLANGVLPVTVKLKFSGASFAFKSLTPIVHTIDLGAISFPSGGVVEVTLSNTAGSAGNGKKGVVRTVDADEDSRPV